jgi:2-methylisocitrate lyase-like PEP mutase family enzyme
MAEFCRNPIYLHRTLLTAHHEAPEAFVIANVWDGGSARMMAALGFPALATSSGASAGLLGRRDGRVTREEALAQARVICDATDLPVSADLEKGFGDAVMRRTRVRILLSRVQSHKKVQYPKA